MKLRVYNNTAVLFIHSQTSAPLEVPSVFAGNYYWYLACEHLFLQWEVSMMQKKTEQMSALGEYLHTESN